VARYAAFLRGINLGSRRRIGSADLRSHFEALGFEGVDTFRTSGNVVFETGRGSPAALTERIERHLEKSLGYEVAIFLRTAPEIEALAEGEPFPRPLVEKSKGKLQVLLLGGKPSAARRGDVLALATEEDRLAFGDRELYWLPSGGTRDAALSLKALDRLLGPTTMRTKGTIDQLAAKYFAG
jgi:uncharacterized protein (DUF1697 family)